jgi:hypothetical protein
MDVLGWDAPRDRKKGGMSGMSDIERREVFAWARQADVPLMNPPRVPEAVQAMSEEIVRLRDQLRGAVEALRFYADEANWKLHVTPSGWSSAAAADDGERARAALRRQ